MDRGSSNTSLHYMYVHRYVLTLKEIFLCHSSEFSVSSGSVELLEGQVVKWHHYYMAQGSYYNLYNFLHKACVVYPMYPVYLSTQDPVQNMIQIHAVT